MFVDAVMANVAVFAVGQVFAWLFLRSGRFWLGAGSTVALWTFIDWWLVSRYLLGTPVEGQQLPVLLLQATAILTTFTWVWAKLRKRLAAPQRAERFRVGVQQLLAGKHADADATFQKLAWADPWDSSAWIGRGDACRRLGVVAKARRCYRRAAGVDIRGGFRDVIAHRLKLLHNAPAGGVASSAQLDSQKVRASEPQVGKAKPAKAPTPVAQPDTPKPVKAQAEKIEAEKVEPKKVQAKPAPNATASETTAPKAAAPKKSEPKKAPAKKAPAKTAPAKTAQQKTAQQKKVQPKGAAKPPETKSKTKAEPKKETPSVVPPSGPLEKKRPKKSAGPAKNAGRKAGSG